MALRIDPRADGAVRIPISDRFLVTVDALRDVEHDILAASMDLTLEELEERVRTWSQGEGVPYGVLLPYVFELDSDVTKE